MRRLAKGGGIVKTELMKTSGDADVATLRLSSHCERCAVVRAKDGGTERFPSEPDGEGEAVVLSRFVFGDRGSGGQFQKAMGALGGRFTWLEGDVAQGGKIYATQSFAVSGSKPQSVKVDGRGSCFVYEDEHARYCRMGGVTVEDPRLLRAEQTRLVFEIISAAMARCGFRFTDTARTWFYLDNLLDWYGEFNKVRTTFFEEMGVFDKMVPASTGIGAANSWGTAIIADVLAVQPKSDAVTIRPVASPLQGSAMSYKSSFSRAVEVAFPTHRRLLISGTASIDKEGKSVHLGDAARQIELTMRVAEALLASRGMGWDDACRGVAYVKNIDDLRLLDQYCADRRIPCFPLAVAQVDICRGDLLFEIELDAVKVS